MSILVTAPLGAVAIVFTGPRLLEKTDAPQKLQNDENEDGDEEEDEDGYMEHRLYLEQTTEEVGTQERTENHYSGDVEMKGKGAAASSPEQTTLLADSKQKKK